MRGGGEDRGRDRGRCGGQTEVISVVLILAISVVSISAILVYFQAVSSDLREELERGSIENEFALLDSDISSIAVGSSQTRYTSVNLDKGSVSADSEKGWIKIEHNPDDKPEYLITNSSIGRLKYEKDDDVVAYQGGGIWRDTGNQTIMLSPPEFRYEKDTLTFPFVNITSNETLDAGTGRFLVEEAEEPVLEFPLPQKNRYNPLTNGSVNITVDSEYYVGWKKYFEDRVSTEINEVDHSEDRVVATIDVPTEVTFENAAASVENTGIKCSGSCSMNGSTLEGKSYPEPNNTIEQEIDEWSDCSTNSSCTDLSSAASDGVIGDDTSATVFFEDGDFSVPSNVDVQTSGDDFKVVVDGDFDLGNHEWLTTSSDGDTTYYINESFKANGNGRLGTDPFSDKESTRNTLIIAGGFLPDSTGGGTLDFDAMIYAPNSDIDTSGTPNVWGGTDSQHHGFQRHHGDK